MNINSFVLKKQLLGLFGLVYGFLLIGNPERAFGAREEALEERVEEETEEEVQVRYMMGNEHMPVANLKRYFFPGCRL